MCGLLKTTLLLSMRPQEGQANNHCGMLLFLWLVFRLFGVSKGRYFKWLVFLLLGRLRWQCSSVRWGEEIAFLNYAKQALPQACPSELSLLQLLTTPSNFVSSLEVETCCSFAELRTPIEEKQEREVSTFFCNPHFSFQTLRSGPFCSVI